ncbi:UPF0481 protein At3g47200-like [Chenopodium quinoa]|uniref:UPF0481 protein At3g47200-like n=1 Tax=Chenopodium quinoa TaxID=63459 RepID=UPI000B77AB9E|nr:UPF0481 protein At3g47200-like [Chenopodium quinoa]
MENNTLQNEIITEQDENNGVLTSMRNKVVSFNASINNCCIYKVPELMLKGYEYFYQPLVMSIGPIYYKDAKLALMQEVKWIYLNSFLQHPENANRNLNTYVDYVRGKEEEIRKCYQQEFKLSNDEFVEMVVLDATFLVYCLLSSVLVGFDEPLVVFHCQAFRRRRSDICGRQLDTVEDVQVLVRNKIFINSLGSDEDVVNLFNNIGKNVISSHKVYSNVSNDLNCYASKRRNQWMAILRSKYFNHPWAIILLQLSSTTSPTAIAECFEDSCRCCHVSYCNKITDLNIFTVLRLRKRHLKAETGYYSIRHLCYTAKQLKDAGVTFVAGETDNPLDITFDNGKLTISKLIIQDSTESYLRNLVYFEQCHYHRDSYFIDYIIFLDQLIDTVEDVQVLVKNKIFRNQLGSDEDVVKLFNNIGKNVIGSNKVYSNVSNALNCYASKRRHRWMAILRSKYFNHPWVILSVIAAFMLFVLTLLQTIATYLYK